MAKNKTTENQNSVTAFLRTVANEQKRKETAAIIDLFSEYTGYEPKMWGTSIVGFGSYHYKYESGREGDAPLAGVAARANAITLYLGSEFNDRDALLAKLGKYKTGKGCLYIQKLEDIDKAVLAKIISNAVDHRKKQHSA
ncbi:MAG TPA: DUF1801 domain-containing protein [Panacibacter sp.]|nr:DUF1801 domain-containing protein [Panacibacter sp.]HNP46230.1 DUF1801 domain-containing protein [Panacibacter sp.]